MGGINVIQTELESLSYTDKIISSFLHPGHSREPKYLQKIRTQEHRNPTENERHVATI